MGTSQRIDNPLACDSMRVWDDLVEAINPASLLVLIERRLGPALRTHLSAEDIFQDALMHAWRDRHQFEWNGLRQFRSWLISIIDHRIHDAADHVGRHKRGGHLQHQSLTGPAPGELQSGLLMVTTTPSRVAIYKEQASRMQEALATLPADLAEVVRLRLFEQLPLDSIATHLGIGVAAVRHRFRKGVALYQSRLQAAFMSRPGLPLEEIAPLHDENASSSS